MARRAARVAPLFLIGSSVHTPLALVIAGIVPDREKLLVRTTMRMSRFGGRRAFPARFPGVGGQYVL